MATTSEVKAGLDDVATEIRNERAALKQAQARITAAANALAAIPTKYNALIATIDAYAGADDFELLAQAEKNRLAAEFNALKTKANAAKADMNTYDFGA